MVSRNGVLGARYEAAIQRPGKALHRGGDFTQNDFRRIDSHRYSRLHRHSVGRPDEEASQGVGGGTRQWILQPAKKRDRSGDSPEARDSEDELRRPPSESAEQGHPRSGPVPAAEGCGTLKGKLQYRTLEGSKLKGMAPLTLRMLWRAENRSPAEGRVGNHWFRVSPPVSLAEGKTRALRGVGRLP